MQLQGQVGLHPGLCPALHANPLPPLPQTPPHSGSIVGPLAQTSPSSSTATSLSPRWGALLIFFALCPATSLHWERVDHFL